MGIGKGKNGGGQRDELGHSNQDHWEFTEEVKLSAKKRRRLETKKQTCEGLAEDFRDETSSDNRTSDL